MIALIDAYQNELTKINGLSKSTVQIYTASVHAFCAFAGSHLKIDPIKATGTQLLKWADFLQNSGIGYSRFKNHLAALKSFFAFLVKRDIVHFNPASVLPQLLKRPRVRTHTIDDRSVFKLLASFNQDTWRGLRNYTMVAVLWTLGLRTNELTSLRVRDFETDHGKRTGLLRIRGKNKKQRALFVVDRLFDDLIRYLNHHQSPKKKLAALFPAETTTAISNNRVQRIVKDQAKKAGIKIKITPRVLRHAFATEMYHQGVPLDDIQAMMGHDHIAETAVYIHVSDKLRQQVLDNIHIQGRLPWP